MRVILEHRGRRYISKTRSQIRGYSAGCVCDQCALFRLCNHFNMWTEEGYIIEQICTLTKYGFKEKNTQQERKK